jgi:hypothetical protein
MREVSNLAVDYLPMLWQSVPVLHPVPTPHSKLLKIHLNFIFPSTSWSHQWPVSVWFPHQHPHTTLSSPIRATWPAHFIHLDFTTRTILGKKYRSFSSSLCNFLHYPVTVSLLGPNTIKNLFSNILSLRFPLKFSDQVSHPYKTTGKLIVLFIFIYKFLDSKLKVKRFLVAVQSNKM